MMRKRANNHAALSATLTAPPSFILGLVLLGAGPAAAQSGPIQDIEIRWQADLVALAALTSSDMVDNDVLWDVDAGVRIEGFTSSGRRVGVYLTGRAEQDRSRAAWGGRVGDCPPNRAACPSVSINGLDRTLQAGYSGFFAASPADDDGLQLALENANIYAQIGVGELVVGYGPGAANLDRVGGPAAFSLVRADNGRVDVSGLRGARTENLSSGYDPKILYRTVPLGQESTVGTLRAAISFTPRVRECGVDACFSRFGPAGRVRPVSEHVTEFGLRYERRAGEHEFSAALGYSTGQRSEAIADYAGIESLDAGLRWEHGDWRAGARWLRSNNALAGDRDYEAWSASVGRENGDWLTTLEYGAFSDDAIRVSGVSWQLGASRLVGERWVAGAGIQHAERDEPVWTVSGVHQARRDNTSLFAELGWQF